MKKIAILMLFLFISGCASKPKKGFEYSGVEADKTVLAKMESLAEDIKMELIAQNNMNMSDDEYQSGDPVTIDFEGTLKDFSKVLSNMGFNVMTIGKRPPFDLYVSLHYEHAQIYTILEDAAAQLPDFVSISMRDNNEIVINYGN